MNQRDEIMFEVNGVHTRFMDGIHPMDDKDSNHFQKQENQHKTVNHRKVFENNWLQL